MSTSCAVLVGSGAGMDVGSDAGEEGAKAESAKQLESQRQAEDGHDITFNSMDGREARLKSNSIAEWKASCDSAPELKNEAAADEGKAAALMNAIS
mmetsp:Transcript_71433/g.232120  ORF Transcript_71433/g.232120 Transcript_71433/m.232120 type:complete len:96 (-) Transcript_71433:90-377(-)